MPQVQVLSLRPKSEVQPNLRIFFILRAFSGFWVIAPPRNWPLFFAKNRTKNWLDHNCHEKAMRLGGKSTPPWGGRGRKFKSCHSDQNRRFNRTSDFSLFYGLFRAFGCLHRLENVRYFFAQNRAKIGYDHMFDHFCAKFSISINGF